MFTEAPLADYLAAKRVGNMLYLRGVIAVDPTVRKVVTSYDDLPKKARKQLHTLGYNAGQMSVEIFETPASVQSWFVLNRIRDIVEAEDGQMKDVFKLVQYFPDPRDYPAYNSVRALFCPEPIVCTMVEVTRMLPSAEVLIEVEAIASLH